MRSAALLAGLALLLGAAAPAPAELSGTVFVDADGDSVRDPGEPGLAGARVSNGAEVQTTGTDGRYAFETEATGFVHVTRPDDFACEHWYRRGSGDFALVPAPSPDEFFFVQISDIHAYSDPRDFARYTLPDTPSWIPARLGAWGLLWAMRGFYPGRDRDQIADAFRLALAPYRSTHGLSKSQVLLAYLEEFEREGSELGDVVTPTREALAEVAALGPELAIATGDLVMEANTAPGDVVESWFELYRDLSAETDLVLINTIGNNEVAGTRLDDFALGDPRYGKGLFHRFHGPTTFSFDRGPFHFVAVDSHHRIDQGDDRPDWEFEELSPQVEAWLDADLAAHAGHVLVVLNHEPFHSLDEWIGFYDPVDDRGLFEKHHVAYALAGHIHRNGVERIGETLHVTTGALSGMRWAVPESLHPRGYRLFYAKDRRLYSAWKEIGKPLLGFVQPAVDPRLFATGADDGSGDERILVAVAADEGGPFASISMSLDGEPLAFERWGDYFVRAAVSPDETGEVELRAARANGEASTARLPLSFP